MSMNKIQIHVKFVGPGLAQLVQRLTHRYSESTSSNPSNLTSATVCGYRTGGDVGCQEVGMCSIRGGSWGAYISLLKKTFYKNSWEIFQYRTTLILITYN